MPELILTIAIPTFNRSQYLRYTLECIIPQITDKVEVIVCDNCSEDDTWDYLGTLEGQVVRIRQDKNIGLDRNFLFCLSNARGEYVWTLCDDDLPYKDTVANILEVIKSFSHPAAIYLKPQVSDKGIRPDDTTASASTWNSCDRNQFLESVGIWFTFGSSIVVRRDTIDEDFLHQHIGTLLIPAAIMLSTVGRSDDAVVSKMPMVYARADNTGGYNGLTVFTKNLSLLLTSAQDMGFQKQALRNVYNNNLSVVIPTIVRDWKINAVGLLALTLYSYHYRCFYTHVVPALLKRGIKALFIACKMLFGVPEKC